MHYADYAHLDLFQFIFFMPYIYLCLFFILITNCQRTAQRQGHFREQYDFIDKFKRS